MSGYAKAVEPDADETAPNRPDATGPGGRTERVLGRRLDPDPRRRPHVLIVGLMGSGKSTVGLLVAERLQRPFVDSDRQLEHRCGVGPTTLASRDGIDALHAAELDVTRDVLTQARPLVHAAAASVLDHLDEVVASADAWVVWLDGEPSVLADRIRGTERPLLGDRDPASLLAEQRDARAAATERACDLRVQVDDRAPAELADAIVQAWHETHLPP